MRSVFSFSVCFQDVKYHDWYVISEGGFSTAQPPIYFISGVVVYKLVGQLHHEGAVDVFVFLSVSFAVAIYLVGDLLGTHIQANRYVIVQVRGAGKETHVFCICSPIVVS